MPGSLLTFIGEFDRVPDEVEQDLGKSPFIAPPLGQDGQRTMLVPLQRTKRK
jgi:hypothetical protein